MILFGEKLFHCGPTKVIRVKLVGLVSGLPQKQRVTGKPNASTSTAVPACSTDGTAVACPFAKPWLTTKVSDRRIAGVSSATNVGMSLGVMPRTVAQALGLVPVGLQEGDHLRRVAGGLVQRATEEAGGVCRPRCRRRWGVGSRWGCWSRPAG